MGSKRACIMMPLLVFIIHALVTALHLTGWTFS